MANKFILITAALMFMMFASAAVLAAECTRSGDTMLITYSPNDLNVGEEFNLTYYDMFGGANEQATLNYPATIINLGTDTVTLINDDFGGGYQTWRLNSAASGNHTVYINVSYEEGGCNITRIIEIMPTLDAPNIVLNYNIAPGDFIAKQSKSADLIIDNIGTGAAYNVNGWTSLSSVIDTFSYPLIEAGNSTTRQFSINTAVCGISTLESTANYQDNFGYNYLPSHANTQINIIGSDLSITEFKISDDEVKKGQTIDFEVTVANIDRTTTINATNIVVKIYKENDNDLIETIDFDDLESGASATGEGSWKVSGKTGKTKLRAVVSSDNECSNWDNNEKKESIKVNKEKEEEETVLPWFDYDEDDDEDDATDSGYIMPEDEPEEFGVEWPIAAIVLEVIALALVAIYVVKRKRR